MSDNIKVVVKVRPLIRREIEDKLLLQWRVNNNALIQIDQNGRECGPYYNFDKVYDEGSKTCDVYNDIAKPIVEAATAGFNGTIFAYGQTSSGKTYTMTGTDESPGIIPLAVVNLFDIIKNVPDRDFLVRVSYVEIYNETLIDLLNIENKRIKIHDTFQGVKVDATEKLATSPEEVLEVMREGKANRQTGATYMNDESSRSHSIFQITIESREHIEGEEEVGSVNVSQLNLVDLAGSERSGQTGATGLRFKEGTHINKSLSVLALVIKQLSEDPNKHANYRDSKLTRILQNSLGGNAKTSIICAVTPAALEETISTLQFANRAKSIKNTPAVNAVATNATMIQSLTKQLSTLKTQLESKKNVEQDNYNLQKRIGHLQRLILNGFGQRSSGDMAGGARRKPQQPRRVTISTLHPIPEDPAPIVPTVPRFCTPSLKYNPMSLNSLAEFAPIQSSLSLTSVAEEPRLITPPPRNRQVTISDEVIEIDSDDDTSVEVQTCSPYHGCFQSSKTPPCILRKNAKVAEKNLNEIVELTEREKIYAPNVVELMEKLEEKSSRIANLEEKIKYLSREKDEEMENLKSKISEAEQKVKDIVSAKISLETTCKDYNTKLIDWEVSYETLQKKAKRREEELLSLLKEHETKKKNEKIGNISSIPIGKDIAHFMDLSRDVTLVHCDNGKSINMEETLSNPVLCKNDDYEAKLRLQNQTILQLEANLHQQFLKIDNLENVNKKFQDMISDFKEKISLLENENALQKLEIDNLNSTIESQKSFNEKAQSEIQSYINTIKELKINLSSKEEIWRCVNDSDLENMIAKEELFIANNENIKNIIQTLKSALDLRNEEIKNLKSSLDGEKSLNFKSLEEELECKKREVSLLVKEIESFKENHIADVDKLISTQNNLLSIEQQLKTQLLELQTLKDKETEMHLIEIANLTKFKEDLTSELIEREHDKGTLQTKIDKLSQEVKTLKHDNRTKDNIIAELRKEENALQENLARVTLQLRNIIVLLSGKILEVPQMIDSLVSAFGTLTDNLTSLETIAKEMIKEKNDLRALADHHQETFAKIKSQLNDLDNAVDKFYENDECLNSIILENNACEHKETNRTFLDDSHRDIELKMGTLIHKIKITLEHLHKSVLNKGMENNNLKVDFESKLTLESTKYLQQIQEITESRKVLLINILQKTTAIASQFDIETSQIENDNDNTLYENIILTLGNIANYVSSLKSEQEIECNNIQGILSEAKKEILKLTEENRKMLQDISNLEKVNVDLSAEIKDIQNDSQILKINLKESNTIMNDLRIDLAAKTSEIEIINNKGEEWKKNFREHEALMNEQRRILEMENTELKTKSSELELQYNESVSMPKSNLAKTDQKYISIQSFDSPPSLLTICCNKIIESIHPNDSDNLGSSSSTSTDLKYICQCAELKMDLNLLQVENVNLKNRVKQLEMMNDCLVEEQKEVQNEVQLLVENTQDLHKKVVNHRTNLSTLTATTYAENKSLASQIKFLQHHHNRFYNVCQKDIPAVKSQLQDLMILLKSDSKNIQNESFKRYSSPNALDITPLHSQYKNESILDGDLLMLDTNITLTTCDNTLIGHDQTCLDATQVCTNNEVACQTSLNEITNNDLLHSQMEMQPLDCIKILDTIESLKTENNKLRDLVDEYSKNKKINVHVTDKISSPIKMSYSINDTGLITSNNVPIDLRYNCNHEENIRSMEETYRKEIDTMKNKLNELEFQKQDIQKKYRDLTLEVPSTEHLVQKLNVLEKEHLLKQSELTKISQILKTKNEEIKHLQEENDILSNQVIETISELDDLKKEHDSLKEMKIQLTENCLILGEKIEDLKHSKKEIMCTECKSKTEVIQALEQRLATDSHTKFSRSYSDSDSSLRCNKICSLQNELHAGKEDCIELKEEVTTIKNHLYSSNLNISHGIDLDDNMENSHIYSYDDFVNINSQDIKCHMPKIPAEDLATIILDRENCLSYYAAKTGANKEGLASDIKLIDIMKMLYDFIEIKHANEIENLVNKLKDFEDSKNTLQKTLDDLKKENLKITKDLEEKNSYLETMANVVSHLKNNITVLCEANNLQDTLIKFKDNFLNVIDKEFGFASTEVFELVIQQMHQNHTMEMHRLRNDNTKLEDDVQQVVKSLQTVNENFTSLKSQLTEKEKEFNLLQKQKEEVHKINATVTLDIVKMEKDLRNQIISGYRELLDNKIINEEIDLSLPTNKVIELLFEHALNIKSCNELVQKGKNNIADEIEKLKAQIDVKDRELRTITSELSKVEEINKNLQLNLSKKEEELKTQISQLEQLNTIHLEKVEENGMNTRLIKQLTEEVNELKATLLNKQTLISSLEAKLEAYNEKYNLEKEHKISQLLKSVSESQKETENLKSMNEIITKEKEKYSTELQSANAIIKQNKIDLDAMAKDILLLKETVKESSSVADNLRREFEALNATKDTLAAMNKQLQEQIKEKCQNCSRLEMNIKTHEKTAEIQSRMIIRLQKQKEEDNKLTCEKDLRLDELTQKYKSLEADYEKIMIDMKSSRDEIERLRNGKLLLEARITDLEEEVASNKRRPSLEVAAETIRRRRQSIHDSKRMFSGDSEDQAMLKSCSITEDLHMDVDGDSSSRSTPVLMHKGRDSLSSKHDQSEREEESGRSLSVLASRRRRQSAHDQRRSVRLPPDRDVNSRDSSQNNSIESEITQLRMQLTSCHKELEELKERNRELDEECEICAEYLRERDEQCLKLKQEKQELEITLANLKDKLKNPNPNSSQSGERSFAHAAVNTDEDWANLHSVVVDRMSYDAQVEKNKKLMKSIEELRFKNQDLKTTIARMEKSFDKHSTRDKELEALRQRLKELDDECETCAAYLRERDEQCNKLRDANKALEAKLLELSDAEGGVQSLRKKRQALHDQRRASAADARDAATNTSDDLLTYQVERDNAKVATDDKQTMELKRLKTTLERVSQQKTELEQQLAAAPRYVATGSAIVQNQQITDVIKENQKLKKMNAKLVTICKKRGKALTDSNRENEQPSEQFN